MREIKFRGWYQEKMYFWNPHRKAILRFIDVTKNWIGVELMQFTGLKDKNGKDIYEGDIIVCRDGKAKIVYEESFAKFIMDFNISGKNTLPDFEDWSRQDADTCMRSIEVIGNIYENPELLDANTNLNEKEKGE